MSGAWRTIPYSSVTINSSALVVAHLSSNSTCSPLEAQKRRKRSTEEFPISRGVRVSRQKFIPVSKTDLLKALVDETYPSDQHLADQFVLVSSCLDSILHAVHKDILEEMRDDYMFIQSISEEEEPSTTAEEGNFINGLDTNNHENGSLSPFVDEPDNPRPYLYTLDMMKVFGYANNNTQTITSDKSRVASRFQRSLMKIVRDAHFEELSAEDLMLTSALNTDYLLTLPVYVDWEKAAESNAIIFRRGYTTEKQQGMLVVDKLDYLQSKLIQAFFRFISEPLGNWAIWINKAIRSSDTMQEIESRLNKIWLWTKELLRKSSNPSARIKNPEALKFDQQMEDELPIGFASQRAVNRYEGFLSPIGPRSRLLKKFLSSIGLTESPPAPPLEFSDESPSSEAFLGPVFLPRISLNDIWRPATRKQCGDNVWRMLRAGISIIFSQSVLQEPAFEELILLYTDKTNDDAKEGETGMASLQLKIYQKIPIPDLPIIFPHKKLSFRILDTVRLDIATVLGLLAYFINYKFEAVSSSPSAVVLDVVAASALILFVFRVAVGYKQTWDRYQLLVNKTLYEKTLASGFGSVHFLLDASEQQQYKECILAYAVMLRANESQVTCRQDLADQCERFLYNAFKVKVEMPIDAALDTLMKFGLVEQKTYKGKTSLYAVPCSTAYDLLRNHWSSLLS